MNSAKNTNEMENIAFQKPSIGKEEEGYYRTAARLAKDIWKSGFKMGAE